MSIQINSTAASLSQGMTCWLARDSRRTRYTATGKTDSQGHIEIKTITTGRISWISPNTKILRPLSQDPHLATAH